MTEYKIVYSGPIVTRDDARASGLKRYFSGRPCHAGHVAQRFTASNACLECRKARRASSNFTQAPVDKLICQKISPDGLPPTAAVARAIGARHYYTGIPCKRGHISPRFTTTSNCLECGSAFGSKWQKSNREASYETARVRRKRNPDKERAKNKRSYEKTGREKQRRRRQENPEYSRTHCRNYQLKRRTTGKITDDQLRAVLAKQGHRCIYCKVSLKKSGYHADHKTAISKGGLNTIDNIQCLCPFCNCSKSNRDPVEFARSLGFLVL